MCRLAARLLWGSRMSANRPPTELRHLRYAVVVAEQGSFRKAALVSGTHVSAISRRIRELEENIGAALFVRHPGGAKPTYAGEVFLDRVRPAIVQIDCAEKVVGSIGRGEQGVVRIGLVSSLASGFVAELIKEYGAHHQRVRLEFVEGGRAEHIRAICEHELDIAFLAAPPPAAAGCEAAQLWDEKVYLVLPPCDVLAARQCVDWPSVRDRRFIVSKGGVGPEIRELLVGRLKERGCMPSIEVHAVHRNVLLELVAIGYGVTLASEASVEASYSRVVYRELAAERISFWGIWSLTNDNPAFRRLLSLAKKRSKDRVST